MSKVDDNKKQKESTLLETAFHLFTGKGFAKTTISDIVQQARALQKELFTCISRINTICVTNSSYIRQINFFDEAHRALEKANGERFEDELLFTTDYIIEQNFKKTTSSWSLLPKTYHGGYLKVSLQTWRILLSPANSTITT